MSSTAKTSMPRPNNLVEFIQQNGLTSLYSGGGSGLLAGLLMGSPSIGATVAGGVAMGIPAARKLMTRLNKGSGRVMAPHVADIALGQRLPASFGKGKYEKLYDKIPRVSTTGLLGQLGGGLAEKGPR